MCMNKYLSPLKVHNCWMKNGNEGAVLLFKFSSREVIIRKIKKYDSGRRIPKSNRKIVDTEENQYP